jgi:hypothetical protein
MPISRGLRLLPSLALLVLLASALAPASPALAASSEGCPNEQIRAESNVDPATGAPYSLGLPECRAYEMVSPLDKQQHDALSLQAPGQLLVSPDGSKVGWTSEGDYADPENYQSRSSRPDNPYQAQRNEDGWATRSTFPPPSDIEEPSATGNATGIFSAALSIQADCGYATLTGIKGANVACALRGPSDEWLVSPSFATISGQDLPDRQILGASSDLSTVVFEGEHGEPFLSSDTATGVCASESEKYCRGIYEIADVGSVAAELRLVNVDSDGDMIGPENPSYLGSQGIRVTNLPVGTDYQAVSADGNTIYFTATPSGGQQTVYARVNHSETVAVSERSPRCTEACAEAEAQPALYEGASVGGSMVFFTTSQPLTDEDTDTTTDLYAYDFAEPPDQRLTLVSKGGLGDPTPGHGAEVDGVVSVSSDGSHVYFVAAGVLTSLPNGLGQTARQGANNLYVYDTVSHETKFAAILSEKDGGLTGGGEGGQAQSYLFNKLAQSTPDGRYLVFDSYANLITSGSEADTDAAQDVYRYDSDTGALVRISVAHDGYGNNGNAEDMNATIASAVSTEIETSALPDVGDINRSVSENGEYVAFTTAEQLQSTDVNGGANTACTENAPPPVNHDGCDVYLWHNGEVNLISDGVDTAGGVVFVGMSAAGSDVFFATPVQLVAQDTDSLGDIYDARIGGGFPAPTLPPSCGGEACQGTPSSSPDFASPGSNSFSGGGNLTAGSTAFPAPVTSKPKPLTKAQKFTDALKQCKRDKKKAKRLACEQSARRKYGRAPQGGARSRKMT